MRNMIYLIVEGSGEETAAPELMRRLLFEHFERYDLNVRRPYNAKGVGGIDRAGGLEHFLELARGAEECAGLLVLRDTERENRNCPPDLAYSLAERTQALGLPFPVVIVCATCEYESWFLAGLESIKANFAQLKPDAIFEGDPEQECNAKGWLTDHMVGDRAYKETIDQVKMTTFLDISHTIKQSRSFQRLVHAVEELLRAIDSETVTVTPLPSDDSVA